MGGGFKTPRRRAGRAACYYACFHKAEQVAQLFGPEQVLVCDTEAVWPKQIPGSCTSFNMPSVAVGLW